jgi:cytochrome c-type biogenesis protein CcmH
MTLWLILALMTAAAIFAVLWPLAARQEEVRSGSDVAVYRDQLEEVERDLAAGLIAESEAKAARVEISRRLLAAADASQTVPTTSGGATILWRRRIVAIVALVLLPLGSAGLYFRLGSPGLAFEPLTAQRDVASNQQQSLESLIAKVEAHLELNPQDGRGWEVLAPVYMRIGRYSDAANAWRNALQILGEDAEREANLGEALMAEANGIVTTDAKAAFVRSVTLDKTTVSARYYLGVAAEQDGKREEAAAIWRTLIAEAPSDAHWVDDVRTALARLEGKAAPAPSGPDAAQMAEAAKQPPEQQTAMIRGMVEGLAARLKKDSTDVDGWVRLVRSYKVLGEGDKAQAALNDAQRAVANDPEKLERLNAAIKDLERGAASAAPRSPTPPAASVAAPPQHDDAAIQGMVGRLAERLKKDGSDAGGWIMLTRSYLTLGDKDKVAAAIKDARAALAGDRDKLQLFEEALQRFKVDEAANAAAPAQPAPGVGPAPAQTGNQTNEMIRGMVTRLADRLKKDGSDFDGWMQLVRSYVVLGERDKAMNAVADARHAIGADADKRRRFDEFVKSLGLEG